MKVIVLCIIYNLIKERKDDDKFYSKKKFEIIIK